MIRLTCVGGVEFTGRTPETIIRREFGRRAYIRWNRDPNAVEKGDVCVPSQYPDTADHLVARILYIEEVGN